MEEESQETVFRSMENFGIIIPPSVSSIRELTPTHFVSICAQCLNSLDSTASIPTALPSESPSERVRICTDIASALKNLGYVGDISFHKFLNPSEEDLNKLIAFLAKRISELSDTGRIPDVKRISQPGDYDMRSSMGDPTKMPGGEESAIDYFNTSTKLNDLRLEMHPHETLSTKAEASIDQDNQTSRSEEIVVNTATIPSSSSMADSSKDERSSGLNENDLGKRLVDSIRCPFGNEETDAHNGNGQKLELKQETMIESEKLQNQEEVMLDDVTARTSELDHLERELDLMTAAAEMAFSDQHSVDFYLEQLNEQLQAKRSSLLKLESDWNAVRKPLEERKRTLEESLLLNNPDAQEMLQKLREVEQEEKFILSELKKRDEEYSTLSADLEKQPKVATRRSYIQRIEEITKNSRKQDADIERILKETREIQLESNSIQESLHRTYTVADEIVFREAKKDPTGRQVYKLLASIHEGFEQISQKILATDRIQREVAEYEMKLAAKASRNLDADKLQADLDVVTRENEYLENKFQVK